MYYVYILKSSKNAKHYIGCTNNIERRIKEHNEGYNASTRNGCPWELKASKVFDSQAEAFQTEKRLKSYKGGNAFKKIVLEWADK